MKSLFITIVSLASSFILLAQSNTSYNANTVPIGGISSVGFGNNTLSNNTGSSNTAIGHGALSNNTTGSANTATGFFALISNGIGTRNTANGFQALFANTTGSHNTANGSYALNTNTIGNNNTANGYQALYWNNSGNENTGNGYHALVLNTTGSYSTANGFKALNSNTTGYSNTAMGYRALHFNTTGNNNTALGDSAGFSSLGSKNLYLGNRAGFYETGSNKLYLAGDSNRTIMYGDLSTGQVLLGKQQPTGFVFAGTRTLNVLGGVLADSIRVSLSSNWSDYVFDEEYKLPTLEEVERFIKTNKHLPGIPTANEVKDNGIELGSMNAKLLEKIEELTLYVLQLKKEIDTLKKR